MGKRVLMPTLIADPERRLTAREIEVLRWAADGKTAGEIVKILSISVDTVNFHIKNAAAKLGSANKRAAVVRAAGAVPGADRIPFAVLHERLEHFATSSSSRIRDNSTRRAARP